MLSTVDGGRKGNQKQGFFPQIIYNLGEETDLSEANSLI